MTTWTVPATVVDVYDGDSVHLKLDLRQDIDLGFKIRLTASAAPVVLARVAHIDAPEMKVDGRSNPVGVAARDYAATLLSPGTPVTFVSHSLDKYGRPLGDITIGDLDFGTEMLRTGHAVPYEGGPR